MYYQVYNFLNSLITVLCWLIIIRMVLSWVSPYSRNELTTIIYNVTEPILRPFRISITLGNMRLDLGPILALFVLSLLKRILWFIF